MVTRMTVLSECDFCLRASTHSDGHNQRCNSHPLESRIIWDRLERNIAILREQGVLNPAPVWPSMCRD